MARGVFMKRHPIDIHVGTRLKTLRLQRGWSQTALAERVDLTFQQIQKYENGSNRISVSRLVEFAQALHVPIAFFFEELVPEESQRTSALFREPSTLDYDIARLLDRVEDPRIRRHVWALIRALSGHR